MALPKKKSSKSRSRRRFSQYAYNQREKLLKVVDQLTHMGKPFIYDAEGRKSVKTDKKETTKEVSAKEAKKVDMTKVEKIEVPKGELKKEKKTEAKKEGNKEITKDEDKGKWFSNIFSKQQGGGKFKDSTGGPSKKIHRRKSI